MDFVHPVEAVIPGAQGRVLAVLVETTAELNLRTLARLAGVSVAQASRVLPGLVELGLVERREVPPSSQFRLIRSNVGARAVIDLARSRDAVLESIGVGASRLPIPPASVIVFGSFARGGAGLDSDLDVVVVRPDGIGEDDENGQTQSRAGATRHEPPPATQSRSSKSAAPRHTHGWPATNRCGATYTATVSRFMD